MLSLGKLSLGMLEYYTQQVALGVEEYYTGGKEAPGRWLGHGALALGLGMGGEVDADTLANVLSHLDPTGTYKLTASRSTPCVAGFDVTFCAPKSVSLLYALGDPEVSNQVRNAHTAAVHASFEVLEAAACSVRRGHGGTTVLRGDGFVAAEFAHRTSRAGDPHLHSHVVIGNLAHGADGKWTALDGRPLYHWLAPAGYLYEAQLRYELTNRLGVQWGPVRNGIADVAGIGRPVIEEFSTRRHQIQEHLAAHGESGARAAQYATYATRSAKDQTVDYPALQAEWHQRAASHGLDHVTLERCVDRAGVARVPGSPAADHLYTTIADSLTARRSTFNERDMIKAVCNQLPGGAPVTDVLELVTGFVNSEHVVHLHPDGPSAVIRRADGTVVPAPVDVGRLTTPAMIALETHLVDTATARLDTRVAVVPGHVVDAAIAGRSLSGEQAGMVRHITTSGNGVDLVEGAAGAGKTYALAAAKDAWQAAGHDVIGCALAARAAQQLETDAGIPSSTIDRLLGQLDRGMQLSPGTVVVVDEAAMVGTRQLARLLDHAATANAKVVLVGDPCQLPEIEAGGAFRGLQARIDCAVLVENRRQVEPWERTALAELRDGDTSTAVDLFIAHERIHHGTDDHDLRGQLVEDWLAARARGEDVLMVASRLSQVDQLNQLARQALRDEGELTGHDTVFGHRGFAVGDTVLALRNDYDIGLLNGNRGHITAIDHERQQMTVTLSDRHLQVPYWYAHAGDLTHGYATTIHKAQGATVDRCLVLADKTTDREHAYTALSRGRLGNDVYITNDHDRIDLRHATELERNALDVFRTAIDRSSAQDLAIDQILAGIPTTSPNAVELQREREQIHQRIGPGPDDVTKPFEQLVRERDHAAGHLAEARHRLEHAQHQLDKRSGLGRIGHRHEHRDLVDRVERFTAALPELEQALEQIETAVAEMTPAANERAAWEHDHHHELRQIERLDQRIDHRHFLDRMATQDLGRVMEQGRGLDHGMGIEL